MQDTHVEETPLERDPRQWRGDGWIAQVIKNNDDEGWAVAMTKEGMSEPALVGPWTMGRNKKDPKPLDKNAFNTLVKTANEFVGRQEQQLFASLNKSLFVHVGEQRIKVMLTITPDDDSPSANLRAFDAYDHEFARKSVDIGFKLTQASAHDWVITQPLP